MNASKQHIDADSSTRKRDYMQSKKPNVIVIYADDLGYGDLSCYGASEIHTPNIDALTQDGIRFDAGYSTSAVCTPARYSLLTGEYPFRDDRTMILPGDAACIISKEQVTLPKVFQQADYNTAVVGKWHLGLGDGAEKLDWNKPINHTPNDIGFDYSFIFPATNDRVPCVYLKNRDIVNYDPSDPIKVEYVPECPFANATTYAEHPELLRMHSSHGHCHSIVNGVGRVGYMEGGTAAVWKDEDLGETFLGEATHFIDESKANNKPFFLFYALHQPHVPRLPNKKFVGATKLGPRGDVIVELDWCVGQLTAHLEAQGLLEDTIVIFSSDNGPVLDDGYFDNAYEFAKMHEHNPAGPLRGGKYSKFDGGARVPLIVSWKNNIKKATSQELLSQVDFLASFAAMLDVPVAKGQAPDSENMINLMTGKHDTGRDELMYESSQKIKILRKNKWSYLSPSAGPKVNPTTLTELGNSLDDQLYNMKLDIGQTNNVATRYSAVVDEMKADIADILNH